MYKFYIEKDLAKFDKFVLDNNGSVFQTSKGDEQKTAWNGIYIMAEDKNKNSVLSCLLLVRPVAKIMKMGYIPLGFVCDYSNTKLVEEALIYIKQLTKKEHIGLCFIDPTVVLAKNDELDNVGVSVLKTFEAASLKRTLNRRPYIQPDTTYIIDLADEQGKTKSLDEIVKNFEKGLKYSIRTSPERGLKYETFVYSDVKENPILMEEFMNVMNETMTRLEASTRSYNYFINMLKNFEPYAKLNMVYYDADEDKRKTDEYQEKLSKLDKNDKRHTKEINELTSKIEGYNKRVLELENNKIDYSTNKKLYLAGGITIIFGNNSICLYGGSKNILRNSTRSSHYLNYKRIEDSINHKCIGHDLSRIHLQYKNERDKDYGLYLFKKSFNADEIKYIGEFAIINSKLMYFLFTKMLPLLRKIAKKLKGTK